MLMTIILIFLSLAYLGLMLAYIYGWSRSRPADLPSGTPVEKVSVVVAARNEEECIGACIQSLLHQRYPASLLEIILVDDDSTDRTAAVIAAFQDPRIRLVQMEAPDDSEQVISFKKRALAAGIAQATGSWIVTTDADCICPEEWILSLSAQFKSGDPVMLVAPVRFFNSGSLVEQFQQFDFMMMQGITAAVRVLNWGVMCNGANLAFRKDAYTAVGGYTGVDHIVSGDDYLLMLKIKQQYPDRVHYVRSLAAAVDTLPQPDWRSLIQQRLRWASKSGKYHDPAMTRALSIVFLYNFSLLPALFFADREPLLFSVLWVSLSLKILVEAFFLHLIGKTYPLRASLWIFPLLQPFHIIYIILVGLFSRFGSFRWKDRRARVN